MIKQIYEILNENLHDTEYDDHEFAAKEITSHIMEFIRWKDDECTRIYPLTKAIRSWIINDSNGEEEYNLEELYQYWFNKTKNGSSD